MEDLLFVSWTAKVLSINTEANFFGNYKHVNRSVAMEKGVIKAGGNWSQQVSIRRREEQWRTGHTLLFPLFTGNQSKYCVS
jgi:hypothetical protein